MTAAAMIFEKRFIFYPSRDGPYDVDHGFPVQSVTFRADDGVKLNGAYCPVEHPRGLIMLCHGNRGNLSHLLHAAKQFRHLGLSVFLFDYRGYGKSEGSPSSSGILMDAEAAYRYITQQLHVPASRLVIFGESLGGGPAIYLAAHHECAALISQSAFTSIPDIGAVLFPRFRWLRRFLRTNFANLEWIPKVRAPKLLIHSRTDELTPFWMGEKLFAAAVQPKEFWIIDHGKHGAIFGTAGYMDRIQDLLDRVLPADPLK